MDNAVPVIDCSALFTTSSSTNDVISQIHSAFSTWGIFILTGTNTVSPDLTDRLREALYRFFSLPDETKNKFHLRKGGWAWRGYMPWGGEGTKGETDQKEGFYGGPELKSGDEHPLKGLPTYGENQFPDDDVPELGELVLDYIDKVTILGLAITDAMSEGLGFEKRYLRCRLLDPEPIQLFRAFNYIGKEGAEAYGIGDHSDFGYLTIISQNATGLQVFSPLKEWVDVPLIPDSFVVNVGDILDRLTSGLYVSPLHHVLPPAPDSNRLSIPFFFDPAWTSKMQPLPLSSTTDFSNNPDVLKRWEQRSTFNGLQGTWGDYLGVKVQKIFPDLELPEFSAVRRASTRHLVQCQKNGK